LLLANPVGSFSGSRFFWTNLCGARNDPVQRRTNIWKLGGPRCRPLQGHPGAQIKLSPYILCPGGDHSACKHLHAKQETYSCSQGTSRAVVSSLIKGTGLIANCSHDLHDETGPVARLVAGHLPFRLPSQATVDIKHPNGEMVVTVFRGDTNTALIAACGCWLPLFLRPENCVVCAIHIGIRHSWANFAIVCSEESWNQVSLLFIEPSVTFVNSFRAEAKGSLRKVMRGTAIFMEINE